MGMHGGLRQRAIEALVPVGEKNLNLKLCQNDLLKGKSSG